jgi:hypothetical protein
VWGFFNHFSGQLRRHQGKGAVAFLLWQVQQKPQGVTVWQGVQNGSERGTMLGPDRLQKATFQGAVVDIESRHWPSVLQGKEGA